MTITNQKPATWRRAMIALALLLTGCGAAERAGSGEDGDTVNTNARTAFSKIAAALAASDPSTLHSLSSGPAAAFFAHADHLRRASGDIMDSVFPHAQADPGAATTKGTDVTFSGPVTWGDPEGPPPRVLTDLTFRQEGDAWRLHSRNQFPIGRWVTPAADDSAGKAPVTGRVVGVFVDVTCLERTDPGCPDTMDGALAVDFEVTNASGAPLEPAEVNLPDGSTSMAWLETPSGGPHPLIDAALQGLPPGQTSPVTAVVGGIESMGDGGVLHLALRTGDGTVHPLDLPVPAYPATWS